MSVGLLDEGHPERLRVGCKDILAIFGKDRYVGYQIDHEGNPTNHTLEEFNAVADDLFPRQEN